MLKCPNCQSVKLKVTGNAESKSSIDYDHTRRYRKCKSCGFHFVTREIAEGDTHIDIEKVRIALSFIGKAQQYLQSSRADYHREWRQKKLKNHN